MIYMSFLHWIVVAVFVLLFLILVILSYKEKNRKTFFSMVFSSFLLISMGIVFSLFALDKYTKKGKLLYSKQIRDYRKEIVKISGKIKNVGKIKIGYCKVEVRISNDITGMGGKRTSYFTPSQSLSDIFGSKDVKSNIITEDFLAVSDLEPKKSKNFSISMPFPPHFVNPKYKVKIFCH